MKTDLKGLSETVKKLLGKYKFVLIIALAGVLLMLIPPMTGKSGEDSVRIAEAEFDLAAYEVKLEQILGLCRNVGRVKVMLTLDSTMESVYAQEESNSSSRTVTDGENTDLRDENDSGLSLVSGGSGVTEPVTVKQIYPQFSGALVVCDGADTAAVRLEIMQAVASLTGLASNKITIIKMKE